MQLHGIMPIWVPHGNYLGMGAFPPMERNACIVSEMDEEAHARLTYTGYGFLLLAEYRFHGFMVSGQLARLVGIGVLVIGQPRNTE
jgi:hypothetical protein